MLSFVIDSEVDLFNGKLVVSFYPPRVNPKKEISLKKTKFVKKCLAKACLRYKKNIAPAKNFEQNSSFLGPNFCYRIDAKIGSSP